MAQDLLQIVEVKESTISRIKKRNKIKIKNKTKYKKNKNRKKIKNK